VAGWLYDGTAVLPYVVGAVLVLGTAWLVSQLHISGDIPVAQDGTVASAP
jgi:hypothetical protein